MRDEELILIGMKEAPPRPPDDDPVTRQTKVSLPIMFASFRISLNCLVFPLYCVLRVTRAAAGARVQAHAREGA